jgi:hypothetical protein
MRMRVLAMLLVTVTFSAGALADCAEAPTVEERRACMLRELCPAATTDAERLACYERVLEERLSLPASAQSPRRASPEVPSRAVTAAEADPEARFGLTEKMRHPDDADLSELQAAVERVATVAHRRQILRLDNDQVWEETEARNTGVRPGDEVIIRRATFGSFRLFVADQNRSTTVRRVHCGASDLNRATRRKCEAMGL